MTEHITHTLTIKRKKKKKRNRRRSLTYAPDSEHLSWENMADTAVCSSDQILNQDVGGERESPEDLFTTH